MALATEIIEKFKTLKTNGHSPLEALTVAIQNGIDSDERAQLMYLLFEMPPAKTKELGLQIKGAARDLGEHQADLLPHLREAMDGPEAEGKGASLARSRRP